jgi:hypothetical protein
MPSEHSRKQSPADTGTLFMSASISRSNPIDFVITCRNLLLRASASLIEPERSCSAIHEWSSVSCRSRPSRNM